MNRRGVPWQKKCPCKDRKFVNHNLKHDKKSIFTAGKSEKNQDVEEEEFHNIHYHPAEGNLQRTQIRVDGKDVDQLQRTKC